MIDRMSEITRIDRESEGLVEEALANHVALEVERARADRLQLLLDVANMKSSRASLKIRMLSDKVSSLQADLDAATSVFGNDLSVEQRAALIKWLAVL